MRITIVMPVLDEAARIVEQLAMLAPLRARGVEFIVVDGGSADATATVAAPYADRVLTSARGRARQMNAGATVATGDVLVFLHADTCLPANADKLIAEGLGRVANRRWSPSPASAGEGRDEGGKIWGRFDVAIDGSSRLLPIVAALMNLRSRASGVATGDQAIFVTRAAFVEAGGYPDQPLMEDIELSRRLRARCAPLCLKAKVVTSGRRWETRGVWRTIFLMWSLRAAYFLGASPELLAKRYDMNRRSGPCTRINMTDNTALIVFAKAPVAGQVKTRLAPALGTDGAARLAMRMLRHTLDSAHGASLGPVFLYCTPDANHASLIAAAERVGATRTVQSGADLGTRMSIALEGALQSHARALLFGCDCPALSSTVLQAAEMALRSADLVFVPVADGGFVLVGARRRAASRLLPLFADIAWSTRDVMDALRIRLSAQSNRDATSWVELPALADIDEPADLVHVPKSWLASEPEPANFPCS